jgi:hypothetical protein
VDTPASAVRRDGPPMSLLTDAAARGAELKARPSVAPKIAAGFYRLLNDLFPDEGSLARYREAAPDVDGAA